jgi:hypothetical protein
MAHWPKAAVDDCCDAAKIVSCVGSEEIASDQKAREERNLSCCRAFWACGSHLGASHDEGDYTVKSCDVALPVT